MLQLLFLIFLGIGYMFLRHLWRNRRIYRSLYDLFSAGSANRSQSSEAQEKRIVTCPYCGSNPEVTQEPCSKCHRLLT